MKKTVLMFAGLALAVGAGAAPAVANAPTASSISKSKVIQTPSGTTLTAGDLIQGNTFIGGTVKERTSDNTFVTTPMRHTPENNALRKTDRKAAQVADVTIKLAYLPEGAWYAEYYIMDPDYQLDGGEIEDSVEIEIPAEGCDIVVCADAVNAWYYLVKHIDPKETDELVFNFDEATNFVGFRPVAPDGTPLTWSYGNRVENYTEGNIVEADVMTVIYNKEAGQIHYSSAIGFDKIYEGQGSADTYYGDLYTNLPTDQTEYRIMHVGEFQVKDTEGLLSYGAYLTGLEGKVSNDPDTFTKLAPQIDHTPAFGQFNPYYTTRFSLGVALDNSFLLGTTTSNLPIVTNHSTMTNGEDSFFCVLDFGIFEAVKKGIVTPGYIVRGNSDMTVTYNPLDILTGKQYDMSSPFYYSPDEALQNYGSGPASMLLYNHMHRVADSQPFYSFFSSTSYGFLGDCRSINDSTTMASASFNGEVLFSDLVPSDLDKKMSAWYKSHKTAGEIAYTFVDKNYAIDGVEGTVTGVLNIDQTAADCTAPTLYGFTVKNSKNDVGYKFVESSLDDITIYATVLDENYNAEDGRYYNYPPKEVIVECAAHGSDAFEAAEVYRFNESPSMSYGYAYSASLKGISVSSDSNLYDLRITATDEAGNKLTETISPALYISSTGTGVESIANGATPVETVYYDLYGRKAVNPANGVYVRIDKYADGTTKTVKTFVNK